MKFKDNAMTCRPLYGSYSLCRQLRKYLVSLETTPQIQQGISHILSIFSCPHFWEFVSIVFINLTMCVCLHLG